MHMDTARLEQVGEGDALRTRLGDQVYDQVLRLILRGEFPVRCKLPTEYELATRFGVSRPVIRGALARLRAEGYVRSQQGSGTFVERGPEPGALAYPTIRSVADLQWCYEFRIAVECQSAALAAERHTRQSLREIERSIADAEAALSAEALHLGPDLNFAFHRAVARATHNPFYITTLEAIPNLVGVGRIAVRNNGIDDPIERLRSILSEHQSLYRAIASRDGARAKAEMESHISGARQYIFEHQTLA